MMATQRPEEFWLHLERIVSAKVERALRDRQVSRAPVIDYLRQVEEMVRRETDRRQTVQIIASGRSLLGDRSAAGARGGFVPTGPSRISPASRVHR